MGIILPWTPVEFHDHHFVAVKDSGLIIVWLIAALLKFKVSRVFCVMLCIMFVWVVNWFVHLNKTCIYSLQSW